LKSTRLMSARRYRAETGHAKLGRGKPLSNQAGHIAQKGHTMYENDYENEGFDEGTLQDGLMELITEGSNSLEICWENLRVRTFEQTGVMTYNKGLVIGLPDGTEYQLTIVQSR
jgi:hypothetical protein